ncbi:hypothetical protein ACLB2K_058647 [Fragaria x ananassa]
MKGGTLKSTIPTALDGETATEVILSSSSTQPSPLILKTSTFGGDRWRRTVTVLLCFPARAWAPVTDPPSDGFGLRIGHGELELGGETLFDGHNGSAAAIYSKENLLSNILAAIPSDLNRDEWIAALPRSLVAGFVKTDKEFQVKAQTSGTTVTFVILEGWVISVASVGDSRCIVEPAEGGVYYLSADHRLECSEDEDCVSLQVVVRLVGLILAAGQRYKCLQKIPRSFCDLKPR